MKSDSKRVTITKKGNKMSVPAWSGDTCLQAQHLGKTGGDHVQSHPGSHSEIKLSQVYLEIPCLKITKLLLQEEIKTSIDSASNRARQAGSKGLREKRRWEETNGLTSAIKQAESHYEEL